MSKIPNLEKWFDRLIRNKMPGPALATAGTAVGFLIMTAGLLPWEDPVRLFLSIVGSVWIAASSVLFVASALQQIYKSM